MDNDGEGYNDWLECLQLVATTCGWSDQAKLVNVAPRLLETVARFYRSRTPQRSNYSALTTALRQRFIPVCIQSVQSSNFHEHKQLGVKEAESKELKQVVKEFSKLFALDSSELGRTTATLHTINTGDHPPIKQPPQRIPISLREKVCKMVQDMLEQGVIVPSASP